MLENVGIMFENMKEYQKRLKKRTYEPNMKEFRTKYKHFYDEMLSYVENSEDKEAAAKEVALAFINNSYDMYKTRKKVKGYVQVDMRMFMIYYVIPALLLTNHEDAKLLADQLSGNWGARFDDGSFEYTDYDTIYESFREKIFGIF